MKLLLVKEYSDHHGVFKIKTDKEFPYQKYSKNISKKETFRIVR